MASGKARRALEVVFGADTNGFSAGMRRISGETRKYESRQSKTAKTTQRAGKSMASAAKAALGLAAAYVSLEQAKKAVETTEELSLTTKGLSRNLGLATDVASRWATVTKARGVDSKAMVMAFTTLSKRIEATKDGTESALKPFKALGITQKQLTSTSGSFSKQIQLVANAMGNAEGSSERQAAAAQLLGRGYQSLLPMFSDGAKGLKEQLRWADEFGATLDGKTIKTMEDLTTAQRKSKVATMGLQIAFAKFATPAITSAHEAYQDFVRIVNNDDLSGDQKMRLLKKRVDHYSKMILGVVTDLMPQIAQKAGEAGAEIAKGLAKGFMETGLLGKVAIGTWVIRSFGGAAAIGAAGKSWGLIFGRGAATGMSTTVKGGIGGKAGLLGLGATGGVAGAVGVAATVIQMEQLKGLMKITADDAKNLGDRLDQINGKADTWQSKVSGMFGKGGLLASLPGAGLFNAGADLLGLGNLDDDARKAKSLQDALKEIGSAEGNRFRQLKDIVRERAQELDLTRQQKDQMWAMVRKSDQGQVNSGIQALKSGVYVGGDLQKATEKQLKLVSSIYGHYTPEWREAVSRTLKAQEIAVRRAWTKNGRLTREGIDRIKEIQQRKKNLLATGDPIGIAKGIVNGWKKARKANQINLGAMVRQLKELPPKAREQAAQTMLKYSRELEAKRKLPEGTVKKLQSRVRLEFGAKLWKGMQQDSSQGWGWISDIWKRGSDRSAKSMANLTTAARRQSRNIKSAVRGLAPAAASAYGTLADYSNEAAKAFGSKKSVDISFFRGGGETPWSGRGLVPSMVSPGEVVEKDGRKWRVPGRPEPRDSVFAMLPRKARVWTFDGQARRARGESTTSALRNQLPHFSTGTASVGSNPARNVPRPVLSGGNPQATATGQAALDAVRKLAVSWVKKYASLPAAVQKMIQFGDRIAAKGMPYQYGGGHGTIGVGTPSFDCSGFVSGILGAGGFISSPMTVAQGTGLYTLGQGGDGNWFTWGVRGSSGMDAHAMIKIRGQQGDRFYESGSGHGPARVSGWSGAFSHRHIQGYRNGGVVRQMTDALLRRGYSATAAAGIVGNAYRESRWNPASVGTGGGGLFGFTTGEISLASLKAAAARKGVDWTDVDFQIGFMDAHMPASLKAQLNATGSVADSTKLFMDQWERPGIPAYEDRLWGAQFAMRQLNERRDAKVSRAKAGVKSARKVWGKAKRVGAKAGVVRGRLAVKNARLALKAANGYQFDTATSRMNRMRELRGKTGNDIQRRLRRLRNRPAGTPGASSIPSGHMNLAGIPEPIRRLMGSPDLSWQQKRDLADSALEIAQNTDRTKDDFSAYRLIIGMEKNRRKAGRQVLAAQNRWIEENGGKGRLEKIRKILRKGDLGKKQRIARRKEAAQIQRHLDRRDGALSNITEATSSILGAKQGIKDLKDSGSDGTGSDSDVASELAALRAEFAKFNQLAEKIGTIDQLELKRALLDMMSGGLAGLMPAPRQGGFTTPAVNF